MRRYSTAWTASSAQRGERRTREDCHHGEREAVSEGNVAENMTVPRKADSANRLDYKATAATMNDCTATATLSALQITTTVKVSQKGSSEIFILHDKSLFLQKKNQSIKKNHTSAIKKSHICGSIWGLYLDIFYYLFVYQLVTVLQLISTGFSRNHRLLS